MFTENRTLLTAMKALMEQDIPSLPMHDGMMVQTSKVRYAMEAMERAAEAVIGIVLPVSVKK